MSLGIGVIGVGNMGTEHIRHLANNIAMVEVRALCDIDQERAATMGKELSAKVYCEDMDIINDPAVEAVVIATPAATHVEVALQCIAAQKPIFCEKPIAASSVDATRILEAEQSLGKRLIQMGFMRRFDAAFQSIKNSIDAGAIGDVLLMHCQHRNGLTSEGFNNDMSFTEAGVHDIDATRWLFGEEITSTTVVPVRPSPLVQRMNDPQLFLLKTESDRVAVVEVFEGCQYGYEVRCEVVGSLGALALGGTGPNSLASEGVRSQGIIGDFRERFRQAYCAELQDWIGNLRLGAVGSPSAWDGYVATIVAESCIRSLKSGSETRVSLPDQPSVYRS